MIPIRDTIPSRNTPIGTWLIILANSVVFVFELMLPDPVLEGGLLLFWHCPGALLSPRVGNLGGPPLR